MAEGFLGRWSQRKQAVREGRVLDEPPESLDVKPVPALGPPPVASREAPPAKPIAPAPPPPTLEDVQRLTPQSDFAPFMAREVAPEVRNAAMRKLFTDPHYNVMDGLDTYIDDYAKPDPLPPSMLRQMASAKFLKLFEDEDEKEKEKEKDHKAGTGPGDDADVPPVDSVAESAPAPPTGAALSAETPPQSLDTNHDHTDL